MRFHNSLLHIVKSYYLGISRNCLWEKLLRSWGFRKQTPKPNFTAQFIAFDNWHSQPQVRNLSVPFPLPIQRPIALHHATRLLILVAGPSSTRSLDAVM